MVVHVPPRAHPCVPALASTSLEVANSSDDLARTHLRDAAIAPSAIAMLQILVLARASVRERVELGRAVSALLGQPDLLTAQRPVTGRVTKRRGVMRGESTFAALNPSNTGASSSRSASLSSKVTRGKTSCKTSLEAERPSRVQSAG